MTCHLYVVANRQAGVIKIGRTRNVASRVKQLRALYVAMGLVPADLELLGSVEIDESWVEGLVHKALAPARTRGEWFVMSDRLATSFVEDVIVSKAVSAREWLRATAEQRFVRGVRRVRAAALRGEPSPAWI